jgi:hypothetical protein
MTGYEPRIADDPSTATHTKFSSAVGNIPPMAPAATEASPRRGRHGHLPLVSGSISKSYETPQTWSVIFQIKSRPMHRGDGIDKTESKPAARSRAACLHTIEALQYLLSQLGWDARAVVSDRCHDFAP